MSVASRAALALAVVLWAAPSAGTTIRGFTLDQLVRESALVVRATVIDQRGVWNPAQTRIYTESRLVVREVLVGAKVPELLVRQIGGRVGDVEMSVPGTADLPLRADVVLFLRERAGVHYLVGMAQGAYHVGRSGDGVERVSRDLDGLRIRPARGRRIGPPPRSSSTPAMTWADLAARVRAVARGAR